MQQTGNEVVKVKTRRLVLGDPLEIVQEVYIWPYEQMEYAQHSISPGEWDI